MHFCNLLPVEGGWACSSRTDEGPRRDDEGPGRAAAGPASGGGSRNSEEGVLFRARSAREKICVIFAIQINFRALIIVIIIDQNG